MCAHVLAVPPLRVYSQMFWYVCASGPRKDGTVGAGCGGVGGKTGAGLARKRVFPLHPAPTVAALPAGRMTEHACRTCVGERWMQILAQSSSQ